MGEGGRDKRMLHVNVLRKRRVWVARSKATHTRALMMCDKRCWGRGEEGKGAHLSFPGVGHCTDTRGGVTNIKHIKKGRFNFVAYRATFYLVW